MDDLSAYEKLSAALAPVARQLAKTIEALEAYTEEIQEAAANLAKESGMTTLEACDLITQSTCESLPGAFESLNEWAKSFVEEMQDFFSGLYKTSTPQKWPRPKNDRLKPLLLDRRPKLYRCRNNC